jgi:hypothetical protein
MKFGIYSGKIYIITDIVGWLVLDDVGKPKFTSEVGFFFPFKYTH